MNNVHDDSSVHILVDFSQVVGERTPTDSRRVVGVDLARPNTIAIMKEDGVDEEVPVNRLQLSACS